MVTRTELMQKLNIIEGKLDKLIPEVRDVSKCIVSMRESMSKAQPANHGRIGKMPRKQPKKKDKVVILDNNPLSIASYMEDHPEVDL